MSSDKEVKKILMKLLFTILIYSLPSLLFSSIDITTIDAYKIINLGEHRLLISKFSENPESNNGFIFQMRRPYCLCEEPTFVLYSPDRDNFKRPKEDSRIKGKLRIDFNKFKEIDLEVFLASPETSQNILALRGNFPSLRSAKVLEIETIYGKDKFVIDGFEDVMKQAAKICESFIPYEYIEPKVEELRI